MSPFILFLFVHHDPMDPYNQYSRAHNQGYLNGNDYNDNFSEIEGLKKRERGKKGGGYYQVLLFVHYEK